MKLWIKKENIFQKMHIIGYIVLKMILILKAYILQIYTFQKKQGFHVNATRFHFGEFTIAEAKAHMAAAGIPMRLET